MVVGEVGLPFIPLCRRASTPLWVGIPRFRGGGGGWEVLNPWMGLILVYYHAYGLLATIIQSMPLPWGIHYMYGLKDYGQHDRETTCAYP